MATQHEKKNEVQKIELPIFSKDGVQTGTFEVPAAIANASWRADLVHQVVTAEQANARQNRANTKDRAEVAGTGRKPWKQKGTGQARHGSKRSPLWRHGGVTFGPRTERDYSEKVNKKMRAIALVSTLARKAREGEVILVDSFEFAHPKTKEARESLEKIALSAGADALTTKEKNAALIALADHGYNAIKSFANLSSVVTEEARNISALDVLSHAYLVIESPKETFNALIARTGAK